MISSSTKGSSSFTSIESMLKNAYSFESYVFQSFDLFAAIMEILQYAMRSRIDYHFSIVNPIALHFACPFCRAWQYYYVEKRR